MKKLYEFMTEANHKMGTVVIKETTTDKMKANGSIALVLQTPGEEGELYSISPPKPENLWYVRNLGSAKRQDPETGVIQWPDHPSYVKKYGEDQVVAYFAKKLYEMLNRKAIEAARAATRAKKKMAEEGKRRQRAAAALDEAIQTLEEKKEKLNRAKVALQFNAAIVTEEELLNLSKAFISASNEVEWAKGDHNRALNNL